MGGLRERSLATAGRLPRPVRAAGGRALVGYRRLRERALWGGRRRERLLTEALGRHYASVFRRQWVHGEPPHYFDHRHGAFDLLVGERQPFGFVRGYLAAELMREGDRVLDIGCGDGFFARRFFAARGADVDAIDVEADAIEHARTVNPHPRVRYEQADATVAPFPAPAYDVVVWDGALGHFPRETTEAMFRKIADVLAPGGAFAGSETLGQEGHDHLQFFESTEALADLLSDAFAIVDVRKLEYVLPDGRLRREAYWRCAQEPERLDAVGWRRSVREQAV